MLKTSDCDVGRWSESAKVVTVCEAYSSCHTLVDPKWTHLAICLAPQQVGMGARLEAAVGCQ